MKYDDLLYSRLGYKWFAAIDGVKFELNDVISSDAKCTKFV